jgi:tRNA A37 threonylcarbamoyladenosine dehydratase
LQPGETRRLNCDSGYSSVTHVAGAFGFAAAARAIDLALKMAD